MQHSPATGTSPFDEETNLTCAAYTVPLATPVSGLSHVAREVYAVLGIDTVEYVAPGGERFVIPTEHICAGREVAEGRVPQSGAVCYVVRASIEVPHHQPTLDVSDAKATLYRALGVDTVNIRDRFADHTVLTQHLASAKAQLARGPGTVRLVPTHSYPAIELRVRKYYKGPPPEAIAVAAKLYGGRFVRVVVGPDDETQNIYWVLLSPMYSTDALLAHLGACV